MCVQYTGGVQYIGRYHKYIGGYHKYIGGHYKYIGGVSTLGGYHDACRDIMSTSGYVQYIGGREQVGKNLSY